MANWRRDMERKMVARGYETARGSSREVAAILQHGWTPPQRPSKAELRRQANAAVAKALAAGAVVTVVPMVEPPPPKIAKFKKPRRWRRKVRE